MSGLTQYRLAKEIGMPAQRIGDIVAGKRAITADTDLRLCRFFGLYKGDVVDKAELLRREVAPSSRLVAERFGAGGLPDHRDRRAPP